MAHKYTDEYLDSLLDSGESYRVISAKCGVSASTLERRACKRRVIKEMGEASSPITPKPQSNEGIVSVIPTWKNGKRIMVIPDRQIKPNVDMGDNTRIGKYAADKMPDIIVCGGDFADMPSLSTYEQAGSKGMEGARYMEDILCVQTAMKMMMTPIKEKMEATGWKPRLVMLMGNHEYRIERALKATPKLEGVIGYPDLHYEEYGWEVFPFLETVVIEGMAFSHYFCSGVMGKPITSAQALLNKKHMSCFAFHQQGRQIAFGTRGDGSPIMAIIAGSCYDHDEDYLNPQTNNHWRGLYILNDFKDGCGEENAVSLQYLKRKYP